MKTFVGEKPPCPRNSGHTEVLWRTSIETAHLWKGALWGPTTSTVREGGGVSSPGEEKLFEKGRVFQGKFMDQHSKECTCDVKQKTKKGRGKEEGREEKRMLGEKPHFTL